MDFVLCIAAMVYEAFFDGWAQVSDGWAKVTDGWANAHSGPPLATPLDRTGVVHNIKSLHDIKSQ